MWLCDVCERSVMIHHSLLGLAARTCACRLRCLFIDEVESHVELYDQIPTISYASSTCVVCTPRTKSLCGSQASVELTYASAAYDKGRNRWFRHFFGRNTNQSCRTRYKDPASRSETVEYTARGGREPVKAKHASSAKDRDLWRTPRDESIYW